MGLLQAKTDNHETQHGEKHSGNGYNKKGQNPSKPDKTKHKTKSVEKKSKVNKKSNLTKSKPKESKSQRKTKLRESDLRVPLILGRPFLRTARALIDVHGKEMILHDGDERLTLNMRHDTPSYFNQPQKESINLINFFNDSNEDFLEDLFSTNQPSGNPTFFSHPILTLPKVKDDIFDLEGGNVLPEKLLDHDSTKDLHPPHHINQLSGSTTSSSSATYLHEGFTDELAFITFPLGNDDLQFNIEFDLKEIEYLLHQDPIKDKYSILKDLINQSDLADLNNNLVDSMPEMFTDEHALDYSSPLLYDEYDDDLFEVESNTVEALPSTNNKDKVFNPGIFIQEKLFEIITRVAQDKKLAISHASLMHENFDPSLYELPFFKEVPRYKDLLRACPHHGFTELHQLDTSYNALNPTDQDSLYSAAGGNLLERRTQDVLTIIENKSKVRNSQNKSVVSQVKSSNANSNSSSEIAKLTHTVNQQTSVVTTAMTSILKQFQATPPLASVKSVEEICVTCGAAVNYNQGNSVYRPPGYNRGNNFKPKQSYQALTQQNQVVPLSELQKVKRMNKANIKAIQTQFNNVKNELRNEKKNSIQASMSNQTNEFKNMMASFFQMNIASTSRSGSLPSNTIANPKGELKAIITRSGIVLDGPSISIPPPFIKPGEDERVEETLTDQNLAEYTIKVPPPLA
nr:hypothetical protein [Tanacetum cinerariifolium]